jgi:hypothetical protein
MKSVEGTCCWKERKSLNGNGNASYETCVIVKENESVKGKGTVKDRESVKEKGIVNAKGNNVKENAFASGGRRSGSGIGGTELIQGRSLLHLKLLVIDGVLLLLDLRSPCVEFHLDVMLCIGIVHLLKK